MTKIEQLKQFIEDEISFYQKCDELLNKLDTSDNDIFSKDDIKNIFKFINKYPKPILTTFKTIIDTELQTLKTETKKELTNQINELSDLYENSLNVEL